MSTITLECDVTEFSVVPPLEHEKVVFCLNDKSLVVSFCDEDGIVLTQSEIEAKDAVELANLILMKYKNQ